MPAIPYDYQGTGVNDKGEVNARWHCLTIPVGSASQVTEKAWLSFKCAIGAAKSVRLMAISSATKPTYAVDQTWHNVAADTARVLIEAPSGCDQFTACIQSEYPYSLGLEVKGKG